MSNPKKESHVMGYLATVVGMLLMTSAGMVAGDWTPLGGPAKAAAIAASVVGAVLLTIVGWKLLRAAPEES